MPTIWLVFKETFFANAKKRYTCFSSASLRYARNLPTSWHRFACFLKKPVSFHSPPLRLFWLCFASLRKKPATSWHRFACFQRNILLRKSASLVFKETFCFAKVLRLFSQKPVSFHSPPLRLFWLCFARNLSYTFCASCCFAKFFEFLYTYVFNFAQYSLLFQLLLSQ